MTPLPASLDQHRVVSPDLASVCMGQVRYSAVKSLWFIGMATGAMIGGAMTFSLGAFLLFVISTTTVLLFGHSLGSHRKLVHDSFQCPKWLDTHWCIWASKSDWLGRSACFASMSFATLRNRGVPGAQDLRAMRSANMTVIAPTSIGTSNVNEPIMAV